MSEEKSKEEIAAEINDTVQSLGVKLSDAITTLNVIVDNVENISGQLGDTSEDLQKLIDLSLQVAEIDLEQVDPTQWEFPGAVSAGTIRWGAAINGNGDPEERHEKVAGVPMGIRRTFWDMNKTAKLIATAAEDIDSGRLPWVSVKLRAPWREVADGGLNDQLTKLFKNLGELDGPVWFTAHHEPENDIGTGDDEGSAEDWRDMQITVCNLLEDSGVTNVAFAPILMAWTFDERSGRDPEDWWVDGIWDFIGLDPYQDKERGAPVTADSFQKAEDYVTGKDMKLAIGEWGNRGEDEEAAQEMEDWYYHLIEIGSPGCCYFDSNLNSPSGGWELKGKPLEKFRELMAAGPSVVLF